MSVDPAVAGALIGFCGGSVTALGTQFLAGRLQVQRLEQEFRNAKRLKDDSEVRMVLDDALAAAHATQNAMNRYWGAAADARQAVSSGDDIEAARLAAQAFTNTAADLIPIIDGMTPARSRLAVRLGPTHTLTLAFAHLEGAVLRFGMSDGKGSLPPILSSSVERLIAS